MSCSSAVECWREGERGKGGRKRGGRGEERREGEGEKGRGRIVEVDVSWQQFESARAMA